MGENIGTTITSNIVAMSASTQARRAAMAHLIFNVFGVIWVLCIYTYFVRFVCSLVGYDPTASLADKSILNAVLAAFHTSFNVCNVLILIWFVKLLEKVVCWMVPEKKGAEDDENKHLKYISGGLLSTAELSILEAKKEIYAFVDRCIKMFKMDEELLHTEKGNDFNALFSRIQKYENITDRMEVEIADYLSQVSEGRLSVESKIEIQHMMRECSELESIGDSCFNIARTISRKRQNSEDDFTENQYQHIHSMMKLIEESLNQMAIVIKQGEERYVDINKSYNIEHEINNYRTQLKTQNIQDINNKLYDYQLGVFYMDLISECEKLGDYIINVIEVSGLKERRF